MLVAGSTARTVKVCEPSGRLEVLSPVAQSAKSPLSTLHWKCAEPSVEEYSYFGVRSLLSATGLVSIVASGAVMSTIVLSLATVGSVRLSAALTARTWRVCEPSPRSLDGVKVPSSQVTQPVLSRLHSKPMPAAGEENVQVGVWSLV